MAHALVALGSNLGDRAALLAAATEQLAATNGVRLIATSTPHSTSPIGGPTGQGEFLNAAALLETSLSPEQLLAELQRIEAQLGRTRGERWAARAIDLDLLLYDQLIIDTPQLKVPHPRMAFRRFVLQPAAEVAGNMYHPQIGWTVSELLGHLENAVSYVAIAGPTSARQQLARYLATTFPARLVSDVDDVAVTSPSPAQAAAIQFDRQARLLASVVWPHRKQLTVSDFWLRQTERELDAAGGRAPFGQMAAAIWPKLVVMLEQPWQVMLEQPWRYAMMSQPMLVIESADVAVQQAESTAAIQAMQSQ